MRGARGLAAAAAFAAALALSGAAAAQPQPAPPPTPEQEQALHAGMLELRQAERTGDREGAIRTGERLLREFPGNRRVEDALLGLYRAARRDDALIALLRTRQGREPQDPETTRELAAKLLSRAESAEALQVVQRHIAANPKNQSSYRLGAVLFLSHDEPQTAARLYRQGRVAVGDPALFAAELAQLEVDRGDYAGAIAEYMLLATDPERRPRVWREVQTLLDRAPDPNVLLQRVEEVQRKNPREPAVHDIAAGILLRMGRYPEALAAIREADRLAGDQGEHLLDFGRQALEGGPADTVVPARAQVGAEALLLLGREHPQSNLVPEAVRLAGEGLVNLARRMPESPERQAILEQSVRFIDAHAGKLRPPYSSQTRALQGMILLEDLGRPAEALAVFEQVAREQKSRGEPDQLVRVQVALCQAALGRLDEARVVLEEVARVDSARVPALPVLRRRPNEPQHVGWSRARYYLAEFDLIDGKYEEARAGFAALAEEAPEDRLANDCLDLALVLNETGPADAPALQRFGAARRAALARDRAAERTALVALIQEHAGSALAPIALFELGTLLREDREPEAAIGRWQELLAAHPEHRLAARALESVGDAQREDLQRPDLAVASYEKLLLEYPQDLFLDGVRKKLVGARTAAKERSHATP